MPSRFRLCLWPILALALASPALAQQPAPTPAVLASRAKEVFLTYCHACHKGEGSKGGNFDLLNVKHLTTAAPDEKPLVIASKLDESELWQRIGVLKNMPPKAVMKKPTDEERAHVGAWIAAGCPPFPVEVTARKTITMPEELAAIVADLSKTDPEDWPYRRYFSLANLHNNPSVSDAALRLARAALSKAINSLHWKARIVPPRAVDAEQTVFAIDLRDYDWDRFDAWKKLLAAYPYGMHQTTGTNPAVAGVEEELRVKTKTDLFLLRADWFVATATQPLLYHALLRLPESADKLEHQLGVDVAANFQRDRLDRAAFVQSGVSDQNRLIERHDGLYGYYWKSYDFKKGGARGDLLRFPLGPPALADVRYGDSAFVHDGGEIIFSLPGGLQGYFLTDGQDKRIDFGPQEVVNDSQKTAGSNQIVNGLSCMACHTRGMVVPPRDIVRSGSALEGQNRRKVERLYPTLERMTALLKEDEERYLRASEKATAAFLQVGPDRGKAFRDLPEPVGPTARGHLLDDVTLAIAAAELGLPVDRFKGAIEQNPKLREYGLGPLALGGSIKRSDWEGGAFSLFQRAAREMNLGKPIRF